ncbi:MAG: CinA family protein [Marinilabiliaceae bacterium]
MSEIYDKSAELGKLLSLRGFTISSAESCTGGLIAHYITMVSGSSAYFKGSVVSYCNEVKMNVLGVSEKSIAEHTEVSGEVAIEMADGASRLIGTDFAISTTGIAGPTGAIPGQPVGTVWIGLKTPKGTSSASYHFDGDRQKVIEKATSKAIQIAIERLLKEF